RSQRSTAQAWSASYEDLASEKDPISSAFVFGGSREHDGRGHGFLLEGVVLVPSGPALRGTSCRSPPCPQGGCPRRTRTSPGGTWSPGSPACDRRRCPRRRRLEPATRTQARGETSPG